MDAAVRAIVDLGAVALTVAFVLLVIIIVGAGIYEIYDAYTVWHFERDLKAMERDLEGKDK